MALFTIGTLTKKGQALIAKCEATGEGIHITKAQTGAGVHEDTSVAALEARTALIDPRQEFPITEKQTVDGNSGVVMLTVLIHNRGLEELYLLNEMGIFAEDPDEGEILYCILVSVENRTYLPADNGTDSISMVREQIYLEVTNAENTTIYTTGALVGRDEYNSLRALFERVIAGLDGGATGQILAKLSGGSYDYGWIDKSTFTGARENFPEVGMVDCIYVDTDSAEIYVWKEVEAGVMGYFKLPLGSEASETLQRQITRNRLDIEALQRLVNSLVRRFMETQLTIAAEAWEEQEEEDGIPIFEQTIELTGMTTETAFDVIPSPVSTGAADLEAEQKAIGIFWSHGTVEGETDAIVLQCRKKRPAADFGMVIRGDLVGETNATGGGTP